MTPEEVARFVLSDCQDPELRAQADRELEAQLATPEGRETMRRLVREMADLVDRDIAKAVLKGLGY